MEQVNQGHGQGQAAVPPDKWWEGLGEMREKHATCSASVQAQLKFLKEWKIEQNGDIKRLADAFDIFKSDTFTKFKDGIQKRLIWLLASIVLLLVAGILNLVMPSNRAVVADEIMAAGIANELLTAVQLTVEQAISEAMAEHLHQESTSDP